MRAAPISGSRPAMPGSRRARRARAGRVRRRLADAEPHRRAARRGPSRPRPRPGRARQSGRARAPRSTARSSSSPNDPFAWYLSAALARRENNLARAGTDIARARDARARQPRHPAARRHARRPCRQHGGGRAPLPPGRPGRARQRRRPPGPARAWRRCARSRCRRPAGCRRPGAGGNDAGRRRAAPSVQVEFDRRHDAHLLEGRVAAAAAAFLGWRRRRARRSRNSPGVAERMPPTAVPLSLANCSAPRRASWVDLRDHLGLQRVEPGEAVAHVRAFLQLARRSRIRSNWRA